jgi:hypothetical protein
MGAERAVKSYRGLETCNLVTGTIDYYYGKIQLGLLAEVIRLNLLENTGKWCRAVSPSASVLNGNSASESKLRKLACMAPP